MVMGNTVTICCGQRRLDADVAAGICREASKHGCAPRLLIDLRAARHATTAALARLVMLRGRLLRAGRDMHIMGLVGRAEALYQITRMENILPRV